MIRAVCLTVTIFAMTACTAGHCRRQHVAPGEAQPLDPAPSPAGAIKLAPSDRVLVFKYDGSAQCGQGRATTPEQMAARDLKGIPTLSMQKRNDGLAHIQACGQTTGAANVFEIAASFLARAEARGFRRWTFAGE